MLETLRDRVGTPELVPKNVICKAYTYPITSSLVSLASSLINLTLTGFSGAKA